MNTSLPILAQPLAPDNIWFVLLLLVTLAWMHHLNALRGPLARRQHAQHHLHGMGHKLNALMPHRHR